MLSVALALVCSNLCDRIGNFLFVLLLFIFWFKYFSSTLLSLKLVTTALYASLNHVCSLTRVVDGSITAQNPEIHQKTSILGFMDCWNANCGLLNYWEYFQSHGDIQVYKFKTSHMVYFIFLSKSIYYSPCLLTWPPCRSLIVEVNCSGPWTAWERTTQDTSGYSNWTL